MRKSIFVAVAVVAVMLLPAGCDWFRTQPGEGADSLCADTLAQELTFTKVAYCDTLPVKDDAFLTQSLVAMWPDATCQSATADSIRQWLANLVAHCAFPQWGEEEMTAQDYEGAITDGQALVEHYGRIGMEQMKAEIREAEADSLPIFGVENALEVSILCQTDSLITLTSGYYIYTGGAHGGYNIEGATFSKADGRRLGWNVIDLSKKDELIALIREGLKEYFEVKTDTELDEMLQLFDDPDTPENEAATLPLPHTEPYLTEEGVTFVYQQYEISSYAAGLPTCVIPYDKMPMRK